MDGRCSANSIWNLWPYDSNPRTWINRQEGMGQRHSLIMSTNPTPAQSEATGTPRTDAAVIRYSIKSATNETGSFRVDGCEIVTADFARTLERELSQVTAERDKLKRWNEEMLTVERWWTKVDEFIRNHPEAPLWRTVSGVALSWLEQRDAMRKALERISKWHGEFPPTGRFWDTSTKDEMSYGAVFGSNGERDYMRTVAADALNANSQQT